MRSAPDTIDLCEPHCHMRQAQRRAERHDAERRHGYRARPARAEQADEQHQHRAPEQRDQRREPGEVDVGALQVGGGERRDHCPAPAE